MKYIVFFSGGVGSLMTAKRVIERYGKRDVILLFTDTLIEDEDLYRFIDESVEKLGVEYYRIADGRDPWQVYKDVKFLGNSRQANCSHELKQKPARKWIEDNFKEETPLFIKKIDYKKKTITYWEDPVKIAELQKEWEEDPRETCRLYLGIDWTEAHRKKSPIFNWTPYQVEFPMCEEPYMDKAEMLAELKKMGIEVPRLYKMGFSHNNCGGFCCRAGQGHFARLLEHMPERYLYHEQKEQEMREFLGRDVSMITRMRKGVKQPLTLRQLRLELQGEQQCEVDFDDIGGCGCFVDDTEEV